MTSLRIFIYFITLTPLYSQSNESNIFSTITETVYPLLAKSQLLDDFKNIDTYKEITKGFFYKESESDCVTLLNKWLNDIKIPSESNASFIIKTIDVVLQIDSKLKTHKELERLGKCSSFIRNLLTSQQFGRKLSQNLQKTKDIFISADKGYASELGISVLFKDFKAIGKTLRNIATEVNQFEIDDNFDYNQNYDLKEKMKCIKERVGTHNKSINELFLEAIGCFTSEKQNLDINNEEKHVNKQ